MVSTEKLSFTKLLLERVHEVEDGVPEGAVERRLPGGRIWRARCGLQIPSAWKLVAIVLMALSKCGTVAAAAAAAS